ncbi:hypothetical protein P389DRAFT_107359 [Cystobasidium minutum MCA 4210]|uniref:uncharacterized protein n=1 Tax=Cystobasidium minutum MCA 4210 TaxID=1397322 RepID=UPI0034CF3A3D|eukprot:jgi/Rhomi1/107359/CE107358_5095
MSNGSVINIGSESAFDTLLSRAKSANLPVVVDFTATWCGPCKVMSPVYDGLAKENPKTVFLKVDIDDQKELASRYSIASVPTFMAFKDGATTGTVKGANQAGLKDLVKNVAA